MLVLLPPSETKRDGGDDRALDLSRLSYQGLTGSRVAALAATSALALDPDAMAAALRLGPTQRGELERNRCIAQSPVMAAMDRYTGVLYDALDAATLSPGARSLAKSSVVIHSALFGLLGAGDSIPAYRLSHDSRLPGLKLRSLWSASIGAELERHDGLILDLRSEAYVALGPVPDRAESYFLRVVAAGVDGQKRALNHFNKKGKGEFLRALLEAGQDHADSASLIEWAQSCGIRLALGAPGELELEVEQVVAAKR
ncbi:YaaA family protein [Marisediminicola antarctica]|uniref:Peroxide stress protein YaaA n=1 Tax=Marisediminicola antarctica TaxID=674079 RepID=A0A7L5AH93_9MICO|nr:peroxide stress protein YaaA [Marisediminicola antarctica]QHO69657.1 hypothetical protein BHD05_08395 [Marisediminicola antarctica]